jgi:hypothetical protein
MALTASASVGNYSDRVQNQIWYRAIILPSPFKKTLLDHLILRYNQFSYMNKKKGAMLPIIIEAAENFCLHQIRLPYQFIPSMSDVRTLLAYIDIEAEDGTTHRAFIGCDPHMIQMITEIFLGEDESDEETLIDMLLETTNMIVGSAKVLATEAYDTSMKIATPFFSPDQKIDADAENVRFIGIENGAMMIAIKRL